MVVRRSLNRILGGLLAAGLAVSALTACGSKGSDANSADGLTTITIGLPVESGAQILPEIAQQAGFFKEEGLTANIKVIQSSQAVLAAMKSGDLQFANADVLNALRGQAHGLGTKILAVPIVKPIFDLIASNSVKTPADLTGKRVGVTGIGNSTDFQVQAALASSGGDPTKIKDVALDGYPGIFAGLTAGQIDAGTVAVPFNDQLLATGKFHRLIDLRSVSSAEYPTAVLTTSSQYESAHPDIVQKVVTAYVKAIRLYESDPSIAQQISKSFLKLTDSSEVQETYDFFKPLFRANPDVNASMMNIVLPSLSKSEKKTTAEMASVVNAAIDPKYVAEAVKTIGTGPVTPASGN